MLLTRLAIYGGIIMKIDWPFYHDLLENDKVIFIHDLNIMESMIDDLKSSFPPNSLHTFAIKSNPILEILKFYVNSGFGLECASIEEVWLASKAGCPPHLILHDGPAKTIDELSYCLHNGIGIIANDETDLTRIDNLYKSEYDNSKFSKIGKIGVRINPDTGYGKIKETSVSTRNSKFGIIVEPNFSLETLLSEFKFINGIHVHIGSQGISLDHFSNGLNKVLKEVEKLPSELLKRIDWIDIGGGVSVNYSKSSLSFSFSDVFNQVSWFFTNNPEIKLITEYGRALVSNSACLVSKIEKVFERDGVQNLIIHTGADAFVRWIYSPDNWWHKISVEGDWKDEIMPTQIHGPLCFSGDKLGDIMPQNKTSENLLVLIHDVGAYVISMWSKHCNRRRPKVLGIKNNDIMVLFPGDDKDDILHNW